MFNLFLKTLVQFFGLPAAVLSCAWWGYATAVVAPDASAAEWIWTGLFSLMVLQLLVWRMKDSLGLSGLLVVCISVVIGLPFLAIANRWDVIPELRAHTLDYGGVLIGLLLLAAFTVPIRWIRNGFTVLDLYERTENLPRGSLSNALKRLGEQER